MEPKTIVLLVLAVSLFGCLLAPTASVPYRVVSNTSGDDRCLQEGGACLCMMCKKGGIELLFGIKIHETNLYKGKCWFGGKDTYDPDNPLLPDGVCSKEMIDEIMDYDPDNPSSAPWDSDPYIRYFMYGFGPTFGDFEAANQYCANNLTIIMAILKRTDGKAPNPPPPEVTKCYLTAGVIPVYVYYTQGLQTTPIAMTNFIRRMQGMPTTYEDPGFLPDEADELGPVIVTPEFRYNDQLPAAVDAVKGQLDAIFLDCKKCMVALAPRKYGTVQEDIKAVDAVLLDSNGLLNGYERKVHIIGQEMLFSPEKDCDFYKQFNDGLNFSLEMLKKYDKPVLWLSFGIADTERSDGTCEWTRKEVADYYEYVFMNTPAMVASGIIGVVQAGIMDDGSAGTSQSVCPNGRCEQGETNLGCPQDCTIATCGNTVCDLALGETTSNCPTDCSVRVCSESSSESCGYGLMETSEEKKQPVFDAWFSACRFYYGRSSFVEEGPFPSDCGNGKCELGETSACSGCFATCGNGACDSASGETNSNCPTDCPPQLFNVVPAIFSVDADPTDNIPNEVNPNKAYCNYAMNLGVYGLYDTSTRSAERQLEAIPKCYYCDECLGPLTAQRLLAYPDLNKINDALLPFRQNINDEHPTGPGNPTGIEPEYCTHLEITMVSQAASKCNVDPMILRAMAWNNTWEELMLNPPGYWAEDVFNCYENFTAYYTTIADTTCNPDDLTLVTNPAYQPKTEPGYPTPVFTDLCINPAPAYIPSLPPAQGLKPCEFGLISSSYLPYDQVSAQLPYTSQYAGQEPLLCGPDFNPLSASGSICLASARLCSYLSGYNATPEFGDFRGTGVRAAGYENELTALKWLSDPAAPDPNGRTRAQNLGALLPDGVTLEPQYATAKWALAFVSLAQYELGTDGLTQLYNRWASTLGCRDPEILGEINGLGAGSYCRWLKGIQSYDTLANCLAAPPGLGSCTINCCNALGAQNPSLNLQRCWDNPDCCTSNACNPNNLVPPAGTCCSHVLPAPAACKVGPLFYDPLICPGTACGTNKCCGNPNFYDFACNCRSDQNDDGLPDPPPLACDVLARYLYLIENCNTLCYQYNQGA